MIWWLLALLFLWIATGWCYMIGVVFQVHRPIRWWETVLCVPAALVLTAISWVAKKFGYDFEPQD